MRGDGTGARQDDSDDVDDSDDFDDDSDFDDDDGSDESDYAQLDGYGSAGAGKQGVVQALKRHIREDEHFLSSRSLLRTSPAYNIHRVLMTAIENAALQDTWRMGKEAFALFNAMSRGSGGVAGLPEDWRMVEGQLLGQQLGGKLRNVETQLASLVAQAQPTPDDLSCEGLCKWAPQEVVAKAISTVASLDPVDRSALDRLAENWREQLGMEEEFIQGIYHHLTHTVQMLWERVLVMLDDVHLDVERSQFKFQRQLEHMMTSRGDGNKFSGLVGYNSFCVSNGMFFPL